ncbi:hypothetical protein F511_43938 [Dorcoceras hygrometricum]|uniref:Uncharacterized protein n=1 Tax=Dorcoceras hygrometricum TaxID=472368 RepID=A0A2Z7AR61_9LAMI|nr:hypothetical protein F511_43938 [Dorcoceras hygrometricum]
MVKRLTTSPHDHLGITDCACKNQLVVVTTIGKSRVARDPIAMHTSWRSNSDIASVTSIGYPRLRASGESSTTKHRLLHASGPHPIPPPNDPKTNQYNQDLGLIHSTNGNHLESPNEGSSIDHQVTIHLHAQNITMFPTNETWYFASQMLVSSLGGLILILTVLATRQSSIQREMLTPKLKPAGEHTKQTSPKSFEHQYLRASTPTLIQAQQRVDAFSKEHENDTVPTNSNDVAELHQLTTYISCEATKICWSPSRNAFLITNLSRLVPVATLKTQRFDLLKRRRSTSAIGSSKHQLVAPLLTHLLVQ